MARALCSALPLLLALAVCQAAAETGQEESASDPGVERALLALQPDLRVAGQGVLRLFGFRIYQARLFVGPGGLPEDTLTGRPYALDLRYARSFRGVDIARRTREEMEKLEQGTPVEREHWQSQLTALFPDVREGDHLSGLYQPGVGTTFLFNGRPIGQIDGDEFARAFFSIWVGPHTSAPAVRRALLAEAGSDGSGR
jgi:hypothetical protein